MKKKQVKQFIFLTLGIVLTVSGYIYVVSDPYVGYPLIALGGVFVGANIAALTI